MHHFLTCSSIFVLITQSIFIYSITLEKTLKTIYSYLKMTLHLFNKIYFLALCIFFVPLVRLSNWTMIQFIFESNVTMMKVCEIVQKKWKYVLFYEDVHLFLLHVNIPFQWLYLNWEENLFDFYVESMAFRIKILINETSI